MVPAIDKFKPATASDGHNTAAVARCHGLGCYFSNLGLTPQALRSRLLRRLSFPRSCPRASRPNRIKRSLKVPQPLLLTPTRQQSLLHRPDVLAHRSLQRCLARLEANHIASDQSRNQPTHQYPEPKEKKKKNNY